MKPIRLDKPKRLHWVVWVAGAVFLFVVIGASFASSNYLKMESDNDLRTATHHEGAKPISRD